MKKNIDLTTLKSSFLRYLPQMENKEEFCGVSVYLFEFAGAIGSGKTATADCVVRMLDECEINKRRGIKVFKMNEDILNEENKKAIKEFYNGDSQDDSQLENIICGNRIRLLIDKLFEAFSCKETAVIISDRAIEEDVMFIDMLIRKNAKSANFEVLDKLYTIKSNIKTFLRDLNEQPQIAHKIIYLEPGLDCAMERIKTRGRPSESQINYDLLEELTSAPEDFEFGEIISVIENECFNVDETAMMAYEKIIWEITSPRADKPIPLHQVLVSFYGVPGSGKTHFVAHMRNFMEQFTFDNGSDPEFCCVVEDRSDDKDIVEEQRKVYEKKADEMTPDDIQGWIDSRRVDDFVEATSYHMTAFVFTDIGPLTSAVFKKVTNCKNVIDNYANWFYCNDEDSFDIFVNVVVNPKGGFAEVRNHIKERGRPGEYEYFTESKLREIYEEIRRQINSHPHGMDENGQYHIMVECENDYSWESVNKMFHSVMETIKNAIIRYSASK